jgi:hypothetical protein
MSINFDVTTIVSVTSLVLNGVVLLKAIKIEKLIATLQVVTGSAQNVSGDRNMTSRGDISVR